MELKVVLIFKNSMEFRLCMIVAFACTVEVTEEFIKEDDYFIDMCFLFWEKHEWWCFLTCWLSEVFQTLHDNSLLYTLIPVLVTFADLPLLLVP